MMQTRETFHPLCNSSFSGKVLKRYFANFQIFIPFLSSVFCVLLFSVKFLFFIKFELEKVVSDEWFYAYQIKNLQTVAKECRNTLKGDSNLLF